MRKYKEIVSREIEQVKLATEETEHIRTLLWTAFCAKVDIDLDPCEDSPNMELYVHVWVYHMINPLDEMPKYGKGINCRAAKKRVKEWYFSIDWEDVIEFINYCGELKPESHSLFNKMFEREWSGFRFFNGELVVLESNDELEELNKVEESATEDSPFDNVKYHLKKAASKLLDRESPDYANSIKESISAVEAIAGIMCGNDKFTLSQSVREMRRLSLLPNGLISTIEKMYNYTSNEGSIRHSLSRIDQLPSRLDALLMLNVSKAVVNYMICVNQGSPK